ncbi:MAG: hypothetical protein AAF720_00820 [Pseudomonadota bacterium]
MLSSKLACRVAGIDRDRFNEAICTGQYLCAPRVVRGGTRRFNREDTIALCVYGHLIRNQTGREVAGKIANCVRSRLQTEPELKRISVHISDAHIKETEPLVTQIFNIGAFALRYELAIKGELCWP